MKQTKGDLRREIERLGGKTRAKDTLAQLEQQLESLLDKPKGTPAPKRKRPGAKVMIRETLREKGEFNLDDMAKACGVRPETVVTMVSDLRNPKYAGEGGPLKIEKQGHTYHLARN